MGRSRNDTTSNVENGRHRQSCKSALHAGWVRSCLQDKSGRTNQACDWPTRTCNASGSRADCAAAGYRVKAGLPCERWLECNGQWARFSAAFRPYVSLSLSFSFSLLYHIPSLSSLPPLCYLCLYLMLIFFFHFTFSLLPFFLSLYLSLFLSFSLFIRFLAISISLVP